MKIRLDYSSLWTPAKERKYQEQMEYRKRWIKKDGIKKGDFLKAVEEYEKNKEHLVFDE